MDITRRAINVDISIPEPMFMEQPVGGSTGPATDTRHSQGTSVPARLIPPRLSPVPGNVGYEATQQRPGAVLPGPERDKTGAFGLTRLKYVPTGRTHVTSDKRPRAKSDIYRVRRARRRAFRCHSASRRTCRVSHARSQPAITNISGPWNALCSSSSSSSQQLHFRIYIAFSLEQSRPGIWRGPIQL